MFMTITIGGFWGANLEKTGKIEEKKEGKKWQ